MSDWICQTPGCGHNRSFHRYEPNRFTGQWDTSCRSESWGRAGRERCKCGEFTQKKEDEVTR